MYNSLGQGLQAGPGGFNLAHLALGFQARRNNDCHTALKSLLYDQLAKYPVYAESILEYLGGEYVQKLGTTEVIQELLQGIFEYHRPVFFFVDGVDELASDSEVRKFLGIIEAFMQNCSDLRIFISCRPEELVKLRASKWNAMEIEVSEIDHRLDIDAYVMHPENIGLLTNDYGLSDETARQYLAEISRKSDDDFPELLYGLPIDDLIGQLPKGIYQAYVSVSFDSASITLTLFWGKF
ncbi:hypothetical protein ABW19_dt0201848 [Dactylella cylindrospora]|nr:hypothetical protein ABW19_dt0201848 [Dactylella cylindrospora]